MEKVEKEYEEGAERKLEGVQTFSSTWVVLFLVFLVF
jgi:hypothetical protein